jgi:nucleotide-binding universal stress UspA family protein
LFERLMVPVDLAHAESLEKALSVAGEIARSSGASIAYVGVSSAAPGAVAHNPQEFSHKLEDLAKAQGAAHGQPVEAHPMIVHDPAADLEEALLKAADETGADLIVMASHMPGPGHRVILSNGGRVARDASASVLVVRG